MIQRAVIFDMDGVISDTEIVYATTYCKALATHGIHMQPHDLSRRFAGVRARTLFTELLEEHAVSVEDLDSLLNGCFAEVEETVRTTTIRPIDGIHELLASLKEAGFALAIASSSSLAFIESVTAGLGITEEFAALASGTEVTHGKPAPDVFLLAASRIGVDPRHCVVIEDGLAGMRGAKAAGMRCIALAPHGGEYPVDAHVKSLREISPETIVRLLERDHASRT
jgi:beta-phosphoglucomutase